MDIKAKMTRRNQKRILRRSIVIVLLCCIVISSYYSLPLVFIIALITICYELWLMLSEKMISLRDIPKILVATGLVILCCWFWLLIRFLLVEYRGIPETEAAKFSLILTAFFSAIASTLIALHLALIIATPPTKPEGIPFLARIALKLILAIKRGKLVASKSIMDRVKIMPSLPLGFSLSAYLRTLIHTLLVSLGIVSFFIRVINWILTTWLKIIILSEIYWITLSVISAILVMWTSIIIGPLVEFAFLLEDLRIYLKL